MEDRFLNLAVPEPMTGCWLWNGTTSRAGYGIFTIKKKHVSAHRTSWKLFRGSIAAGLMVCHKCDTPACVNPQHLFLGTALDNSRDSKNKMRAKCVRQAGSANDNSRVTEEQVAEIRKTYVRSNRQFGHRALAKRFGVSPSAIYRIVHNESWNHI